MQEFEHESLLVVDESTQYVTRKRVELLKPLSAKRFGLFSSVWESRGWHIERTRWTLQGETLVVSAAWLVRPAHAG